MNDEIEPKYFPWEYVQLGITEEMIMVTKIGISHWGKIDYLCWNWKEYGWYDDFQLSQVSPRVIWFKVKKK